MKGLTKSESTIYPLLLDGLLNYFTLDHILIICTLDTVNLQIITIKTGSKEYSQNLV